MARSATSGRRPQLTLVDEVDSAELDLRCSELADQIQEQRIFGRVPLFLIGAGISRGKVPLLADIGKWFEGKLKVEGTDEGYEWVVEHASAIGRDLATRRQAAEFFAAMQTDTGRFAHLWEEFSRLFLTGPLEVPPSEAFQGIASQSVKPTDAHRVLARLLAGHDAHAVSLNFDGLTHLALIELHGQGIVLHSPKDIETYFCAPASTNVPAIVKIRGDVFYARCKAPACGLSATPYPIDRLRYRPETGDPLRCPNCGGNGLLLQFEFPGYRAKEELAATMLRSVRQFLTARVSTLVIIGLSGRWDRYMLEFLFDFAVDQRIPVIDVKPSGTEAELIDRFRSLYYPSVTSVETRFPLEAASYTRVRATANDFLTKFGAAWYA